ncbi:uncharacterized protein BP5553_01287 [Venustampulla echinocandica]|uniref:Uncharacterized protein n=1 Tax=Venustampulla echinocandica TaxID=2656787 RepID=A0A370U0K6_9HELO|nr:uncharacterized protein BP5553_01287 [Venustampulla echinocandica]RDL41308.1 hypothetical protein BP5553_01287 [Venustampulla echinocandica]
MSTFKELVKHQPSLLAAVDVRNWTLLHLAIDSKQLDIMRLLIKLGADPHARTSPTTFFIPIYLRGLSLSPGDIARTHGRPVVQAYLDALASNGLEFRAVCEEKDDSYDIFWPAFEQLEGNFLLSPCST